MRKLFILLLVVSSFGCKNDGTEETVSTEAKIDVEPKLNITETTHYKVTVEESRELRRASIDNQPTRSATAVFDLTVQPVGEEVHFLWSSPEIESMPVETREQKIEYLIARFGGVWSPSFAVDRDGKFLRVLDERMVRAGHEAIKYRAKQASDPRILKQIESLGDPLETVTNTAVQRWNELAGAFLPYRFAYGVPIDVELGTLTALEQTACPTGECWRFKAETEVSRGELSEIKEQLKAMDAQILEGRRVLTTTNDNATMLPNETRMEFTVELQMRNDLGAQEKGGITMVEDVLYEKKSEVPTRVQLTELPSFDAQSGSEVSTDAGSGSAPDAGVP